MNQGDVLRSNQKQIRMQIPVVNFEIIMLILQDVDQRLQIWWLIQTPLNFEDEIHRAQFSLMLKEVNIAIKRDCIRIYCENPNDMSRSLRSGWSFEAVVVFGKVWPSPKPEDWVISKRRLIQRRQRDGKLAPVSPESSEMSLNDRGHILLYPLVFSANLEEMSFVWLSVILPLVLDHPLSSVCPGFEDT
jgi:hypothetical protein